MSAPATASCDNKDGGAIELTTHSSRDEEGCHGGPAAAAAVYRSTSADDRDMRRMGRKQEFIRQYRLFSMISFGIIATSAWCFNAFKPTPALINGGLPSMIWSKLWCFAMFVPIILSIAEMASMAPTAGGQYHWVSEFAPENCQQILSYVAGYVLVDECRIALPC